MPMVDISELDIGRLFSLGERLGRDISGSHAVALAYMGDRLGIWKLLAEKGPMTSAELAQAAGLNPRYVREWCRALVVAGYVEQDFADDRFFLTKEQIFQLADESGPAFIGGAHQLTVGVHQNVHRLLQHFKQGGGIPYSEVGMDVTMGVERLWAPFHEHFLAGWLGKIPGLTERLAQGGRIADVGCGRGRASVRLAELFPQCSVVGIDRDLESVKAAQELAAKRGLGSNPTFRAGTAAAMEETGAYDLIYLFYALHDMPDAVPALRAMRKALRPDGVLLCVEPAASDNALANRDSPARMFATMSPLFNLPVAMAEANDGSGTVLTEPTIRSLAQQAGFTGFEQLQIDFPPPSRLHSYYALRV